MTTHFGSQQNPTSTTVVWSGKAEDLTKIASGGRVATATYTLTEDALKFSSGLLSSREETVPLWALVDVDLTQSMTQKARGVADLQLRIDPSVAGSFGQAAVMLKSIRDARSVRETILRQANAVRAYWAQHQHDRAVEQQRAGASYIGAPAQPAPTGSGDDMLARLTQLGELHKSGVLTDDEFAAAKAKLLS